MLAERNIEVSSGEHVVIRFAIRCYLVALLCTVSGVGCMMKTEEAPAELIIPLGGTRYVDISSNRNQVTLGGLDTISVFYAGDSDKIDKIVYHLLTQDGWLRGVDTNADGVIDIRIYGKKYQHSSTNDKAIRQEHR